MEEKLIKKNCKTGEYEGIYPITSLSAVIDPDTGESLDQIINKYNHIFLPFIDNSKALTRKQVPSELRRKGLWVTYISCKGNAITEWFKGDDLSDSAWEDSSNWVPYINDELLRDMVNNILSWYIVR